MIFYLWSFISNVLGNYLKLDSFIYFLQEQINKVISSNYQGNTQKFISYLLLNKKDKEIYSLVQDFRDLSLIHLIVISGFHMHLLKNFLSKLIPSFAPQILKKGFLLSSLFLYSWATAFSIPSTRIFFEEVGELSLIKKEKKSPLTTWSKSIWITFLIFPSAISSLSFVLSYFFSLVFKLISKLRLTNINELLLKNLTAYLISLFFFSFKTKKLFLIAGLNQFLFTPIIICLFLFYLFIWPFKFVANFGTNLYEFFMNSLSSFSLNKLYLPREAGSSIEIFYFLLFFSLLCLGISFLYKFNRNN
ncbi:ComEC/Rec2 family competence protein [Mycoplasma parvum]|uniref:ComEC/Rec2 family competence protein n=1 Tax=Mycoplasma parvum TaxID=984991 RepID=UPI001183DEA3|nr:ComEC/Rec2 family competence protein [Mycoplasma parvum]